MIVVNCKLEYEVLIIFHIKLSGGGDGGGQEIFESLLFNRKSQLITVERSKGVFQQENMLYFSIKVIRCLELLGD